jgi:hypothetical protein
MLFLVFVALLVAFLVVVVFSKRFAVGAFFISALPKPKTFNRATLILAGVFGMAGCTAGGGLFTNPESPASLRLVTLDETPQSTAQAGVEIRPATFIETDDSSSSAWCQPPERRFCGGSDNPAFAFAQRQCG